MRIIERGQHQKEKLYQLRCLQCGTKFEFRRHEAKTEMDRNDYFLSIPCPVCQTVCTTTP